MLGEKVEEVPGERHAFVLEATGALLDLAQERNWQVGGFELLGG